MSKITEILLRRKRFSLISTGNSMRPILHSGDMVFYEKIPFASLRENDIVLIRKEGRLFTHRIIYKTPGYAITRGDGNMKSDGNISPGDILARAISLRRSGRIIRLDDFYTLQAQNYTYEIDRVADWFRENRRPFVFLKGLPLHLYYEGRQPRRLYFDCDILIRHQDKERFISYLKQHGYQRLDTSLSGMHARLKNSDNEESYYKLVGNFPVVFDVHFEVSFLINQLGRISSLYPPRLMKKMTQVFLDEAVAFPLNRRMYPLLAPPHLVTFLALHFCHHNFRGPARLSLIDRIIRKNKTPDLLFAGIAKDAHHFQLQGYVYPIFVLLEKYYRTPIPPAFLNSIAPGKSVLSYINRSILPAPVFDEETRIFSGMLRFRQLFSLSPVPLHWRILVFLHPGVIYSIVWAIARKIKLWR